MIREDFPPRHNVSIPWVLRWFRLVSYRGIVNFYIGWRPYGAFGIKLNRGKK